MDSSSNSVNADLAELIEIQPPQSPEFNRRLLLNTGIPIPPLTRLETFSSSDFEAFTLEFVHGALKQKYTKVLRPGGANDMGRDVIAFTEDNNVWDNYQCKHYAQKLTPTDFWIEIGKVCYYSFEKKFSFPREYYIVTCKGIGPALGTYLENPALLKEKFLENWDTHCSNKITEKGRIELSQEFRDYIDTLDFSRFKPMEPIAIIELHSQTPHHAFRFGGGLRARPKVAEPPLTIKEVELEYTSAIFEAFSQHSNTTISNLTDVTDDTLRRAFHRAREGFYSAESLKEFVRDNLPDDDDFEELLNETYDGVEATVTSTFKSGYDRMRAVEERATILPLSSCTLSEQVKQKDRIGFCHHLTNRKRIKWV